MKFLLFPKSENSNFLSSAAIGHGQNNCYSIIGSFLISGKNYVVQIRDNNEHRNVLGYAPDMEHGVVRG